MASTPRSRVIGDANEPVRRQDADRPTIAQLFDRADERLEQVRRLGDATGYEQIVHPASDVEPHELYAC
jgi:hypothetical protein